jgi:hypothetical protein
MTWFCFCWIQFIHLSINLSKTLLMMIGKLRLCFTLPIALLFESIIAVNNSVKYLVFDNQFFVIQRLVNIDKSNCFKTEPNLSACIKLYFNLILSKSDILFLQYCKKAKQRKWTTFKSDVKWSCCIAMIELDFMNILNNIVVDSCVLN